MIPKKLRSGDHIRVIAPSEGLAPKLTKELRERGVKRLGSLGLKVSFGKYLDEQNEFDSATVEHRLHDLHEAFKDPGIQAIISANGGSSANQLLKHVDYELIKANPKVFCGLSDLTEVTSAIYAKAGLVTYNGPHFSMLSAGKIMDHSLENMRQTFFSEEPVTLSPSEHYLNDQWEDELIVNSSYWTINEGEAEATCMGGNLMTFNFLAGNQFMPDFKDCILYLEENHIVDKKGVQKELQEILNHPLGETIKGVLIGRFQRETGMSRELLTKMIKTKKELKNVPVIGNVDFSHTAPMVSIPFGGKMKISAKDQDEVSIKILEH